MRSPLVVGYKGEIGSFILGGLLKTMPKALDIWCVDANETEDEVAERIGKSDFVFLCVPLEKTEVWLARHRGLLKGKVVVEQCSLKEPLLESEAAAGLDVRSMHVLFRPSQTPNPADREVALFAGQFDDDTAGFIGKLTGAKVAMFRDAAEHDREMAIQQAMFHRMLLIMDRMAGECHGSTFIGKRVSELAARIRGGDPVLYGAIQLNRHLPEQLERLNVSLAQFDIGDYMRR